ncbi:uncharacterized protein LOC113307636 [Papaver somniferum]|uniref:uncharacterized protein LOC113307636 n=1 Tax=Papaver somniferum TaxID=3469 RepID=UPI000E6F862E|nr:uncharacterized protein LOC113307636 [Papaver somniferum]
MVSEFAVSKSENPNEERYQFQCVVVYKWTVGTNLHLWTSLYFFKNKEVQVLELWHRIPWKLYCRLWGSFHCCGVGSDVISYSKQSSIWSSTKALYSSSMEICIVISLDSNQGPAYVEIIEVSGYLNRCYKLYVSLILLQF